MGRDQTLVCPSFGELLFSHPQSKFDITVSNFSLLDLQSYNERMKIIDALWEETKHFMILVEAGTMEGFFTLQEARGRILGSDSLTEAEEGVSSDMVAAEGFVFAPVSMLRFFCCTYSQIFLDLILHLKKKLIFKKNKCITLSHTVSKDCVCLEIL